MAPVDSSLVRSIDCHPTQGTGGSSQKPSKQCRYKQRELLLPVTRGCSCPLLSVTHPIDELLPYENVTREVYPFPPVVFSLPFFFFPSLSSVLCHLRTSAIFFSLAVSYLQSTNCVPPLSSEPNACHKMLLAAAHRSKQLSAHLPPFSLHTIVPLLSLTSHAMFVLNGIDLSRSNSCSSCIHPVHHIACRLS